LLVHRHALVLSVLSVLSVLVVLVVLAVLVVLVVLAMPHLAPTTLLAHSTTLLHFNNRTSTPLALADLGVDAVDPALIPGSMACPTLLHRAGFPLGRDFHLARLFLSTTSGTLLGPRVRPVLMDTLLHLAKA
jgi:hypothetical protein